MDNVHSRLQGLECFEWFLFWVVGGLAVLGLSDAHPVLGGGRQVAMQLCLIGVRRHLSFTVM